MTPGQRMTRGTRQPPSQFVSFSDRNAVVPPSGQLSTVVGGPHHDRVVGDAQVVEFFAELADMTIVFDHAVWVSARPCTPCDSLFRCGRRAMDRSAEGGRVARRY